MFSTLLLHSIQQLQGERSASAIYHMLIGKKSSQTFQDVHAYDLSSFFGVFRSLTREELKEELENLHKRQLIVFHKQDLYLSEDGRRQLEAHPLTSTPLSWLNGTAYSHLDQVFWGRLLVFVQTASNIAMGNHQFIPVVDQPEILKWVKETYRRCHLHLTPTMRSIYEELHDLLTVLPQWLSELVTLRLSGAHRYGLSKEQLAFRFQLSLHDVTLVLQSVIHFFLEQIVEQPEKYRYLYQFCEDLYHTLPLTQSAQKTLEWMKKGQPIERIAQIRNLKMSTIQDHVVEIALVDPHFQVEEFVTKDDAQTISHTARKLNTNRLKTIREALANDFSYFEIRLVLAAAQGAIKS